jgi:hypothetical protein
VGGDGTQNALARPMAATKKKSLTTEFTEIHGKAGERKGGA